MTALSKLVWGATLAMSVTLGAMPATAAELAEYRGYRFGATLPAVAQKAGSDPLMAKVIQQRPALIQDLAWRPAAPDSRTGTDRGPVREIICRFYDGELFQITVSYDRFETEGMTADDYIEAISATYGPAEKPSASEAALAGSYGEEEAVLTQWQDSNYRFRLIRSSYGPTFRLVGVAKRLETAAAASQLEAKRLDEQEAPQREATRVAAEEQATKAKLEKARLVNKPKFRP